MSYGLGPGEWAVLALLCQQPAHGWSLGMCLAPSGELGRIWSVSRPVVYRSIETLTERELVDVAGNEPGDRGPRRTLFTASSAGRLAVLQWLEEPVEHGRDSRSVLLLKLVFADRLGIDPRPTLVAQHRTSAAALRALEAREPASAGTERMLVRFRAESTRGVLRFVEEALREEARRSYRGTS